MGNLQNLRAKALSLRGALALGGAVVVVASMTQVAGTLAVPEAVRTASVSVSTANYFPTPLAASISCETIGLSGSHHAKVNWNPPPTVPGDPPINYRYKVVWSLDATSAKYSFETSNTTTGEFRIYDQLGIGASTAKAYRIFVHTINPVDRGVVSSGAVSVSVYTASTVETRCSPGVYRDGNQDWENGYASGVGRFQPSQELDTLDLDGADIQPEAETTAVSTSRKPLGPDSSPIVGSDSLATGTSAIKSGFPISTHAPDTTAPTSPTTVGGTMPSSATESPTPTSVAAVRSPAQPLALPSGRSAKIVGDTMLVVSDDSGLVCRANVQENSVLRVSDGVLEVADSVRTRVVNQATCAFG